MFKKIFNFISPPENWKIPVIFLSSFMLGLIIFLFYISNAASYLSDEPSTCVNCHIMGPQYTTWFHSSHREVATCNDCHVPHDNIFNTYFFKAKDGFRHASVFTMRNEPQVIYIKDEGKNVVQQNCKRCHIDLITNYNKLVATNKCTGLATDDSRVCWDCHRETPHGRVNSLSSTPHAMIPKLESPVPNWLKKLID